MATLFADASADDLSGYTLILSAVSVGNVGQLAVDLLLANVKECAKIGRIYHDGLEPVVGNEIGVDGSLSLLTACQVHRSKAQKLVIVQFHAPVLAREAKNFADFLVDWIQSANISQVVCLSSTYASERVDNQIQGLPFRYLRTNADSSRDLLAQSGWKELEHRSFPAPPVYEREAESPEAAGTDAYVPGSGITKELLSSCESKNIPLVVLLMFVSEGDNTEDAKFYFSTCNQVFRWADCDTRSLQIPRSWDSMYGNDFPAEIY